MKSPIDILEDKGTRAEKIAARMYKDLDAPLHNFSAYLSFKNEYLIVHLGVDDPTRKGMFCWTVIGEVHIDDKNKLKYFVRLPLDEHPKWVDGKYDNGVRELPCPQNVKGMLETMDNFRTEFLKTGYMNLLNNLNLKAIEELP